jgi:hypothetical protein
MTICIAAACEHDKKPAIVTATDWKITTGTAGAEVLDKLRWLGNGWGALIAGNNIANALLLVDRLTKLFWKAPPLKMKIRDEVHRVLNEGKSALIDSYVESLYGHDYDWFLSKGREGLPSDIYLRHSEAISNLKFDAELIICGFSESVPLILSFNESMPPYVWSQPNFAVAGSGSEAAWQSLCFREHRAPEISLMQAIYNVWEAKVLGETASDVGDLTSIEVMFSDGTVKSLSDAGHDFCDSKLFPKFGPKMIDIKENSGHAKLFTFRDDYLEDFEYDWDNPTPKAPPSPQ